LFSFWITVSSSPVVVTLSFSQGISEGFEEKVKLIWCISGNWKSLGIIFYEALNDYEAGLKVRFDVISKVESEALLPEIVLTEDETDALKFPIDRDRNIEGGQEKVDKTLMEFFETMLQFENLLADDPQSVQL
jgi:hypothetical protein